MFVSCKFPSMVSWSFYLQLSHGDICIFLFGVHCHYIRICCLCLGFASSSNPITCDEQKKLKVLLVENGGSVLN